MECILFEKRFCFKPNFLYSFVAYAAFFLVFAVRISLLLFCFFFFSTRSTRTCRCHGKYPFSDLQFFW